MMTTSSKRVIVLEKHDLVNLALLIGTAVKTPGLPQRHRESLERIEAAIEAAEFRPSPPPEEMN